MAWPFVQSFMLADWRSFWATSNDVHTAQVSKPEITSNSCQEGQGSYPPMKLWGQPIRNKTPEVTSTDITLDERDSACTISSHQKMTCTGMMSTYITLNQCLETIPKSWSQKRLTGQGHQSPIKTFPHHQVLFYSNHLPWRVKWSSPFPFLPVLSNFSFDLSLHILEFKYPSTE